MGLLKRINSEIRSSAGTGPASDYWYYPGGSFYGGLAGAQTKSGSHISEFNAMQLAIVWCCIKILSEDTASLPLHLYRRRKSGGKDRAWAEDLYYLMHDRPNPEMSALSFREAYAAHLLSWGNGYAEKQLTKGRIKKIIALWPVTPNRVSVKRNEKDQLEWHVNIPEKCKTVVLDRSRIMHTPGLSFNGIVGYSPIGAAKEAIGLGKSLEEFGALYFGQGTHPGVVAYHPGKLSAQGHSNLEGSLAQSYSGLGKSHRLMLLEEGMRIEKIGIPNDEAQFLETRRFTNIDIGSRIYRLFPQQYGEFEHAATYASAEQFAIDYVTKVLRPWLVRLEQSYNFNLIDESDRGRFFFEHNVEGLLRGDIKTRYEAHQIARRNGVINADDWRAMENMNPVEDEKVGKAFVVEKNMVRVEDLGKEFNRAPGPEVKK